MQISEKKTKAMIFNFTENYQFTTRPNLKETNMGLFTNVDFVLQYLVPQANVMNACRFDM